MADEAVPNAAPVEENKDEQKNAEMAEFDVIVLGTGLKECILSGLLSSSGKKVLHLDRNAYYGGDSASLNLDQLFEKFKPGQAAPANLGRAYDYCVDVCPKFLMASEDIIRILVKTKVSEYLDFAGITGSYVYAKKKVHKVPSNAKEAFSSGMLSLLEKNSFRKFLSYVVNFDPKDPKTANGYDLNKLSALELYKKFGLGDTAMQFTGHAIALYTDDTYLAQPAIDLVLRSQLYAWSVARYNTGSPYLYPKFGLGGLPEGFSRRCAVHGGTFMLNMGRADPFVEKINYDGAGKVESITLGADVVKAYELPTQVIKCKTLVSDPTYVNDKVKKVGEIARCIAILNHALPDTNESDSCQLILPANEIGRKSDIYVCVTSAAQKVAPKGKFVAVMSTVSEGKTPEENLAPALALLGPIEQQFVWSTDLFVPLADGTADNVFVPTSVDASTHFVSTSREVLALFQRITGEPFDLTPPPKGADAGEDKEDA